MRRFRRHGRLQMQGGSALFLILLAVVLFAALSYAVTSSLGGGKDGGEESAKAVAAEIVQYAASVKTAVDRLLLVNGCTDTQISFENPVVGGYVNSNAPPDKRCHVFDPNGGGLSFKNLRHIKFYIDPSYGNVAFLTGNAYVAWNFGTNAQHDVFMAIRTHPNFAVQDRYFRKVCEEINKMAGIPSTKPVYIYNGAINTNFTGTYITPMPGWASGDLGDMWPYSVFCTNGGAWDYIVAPLILR